jgi:ubiquinone/menaquinone biosynthesis C-methylase UbiE/DNA-binding transcriptional ArsR family regulator
MSYLVPALTASALNQTNPLASILKAAGDSLRLEILRLLGRDSLGVSELSRLFGTKQSGMSHHLKVLSNAELVVSRREGNSIFYRRALPRPQQDHFTLLQSLFTSIDKTVISATTLAGLSIIQDERAITSREFFANNAEKFRAQQDLIASYPAYADAIVDMLDLTSWSEKNIALEIGPGEGEFIEPLSKRFGKVIALDNSASMLDKAQRFCQLQKLNNIEFMHGDTQSASVKQASADCVVINMVLHHTPSPASVIQDASSLLADDGVLLITELCQHDQQWAMQACGDVWLGFDPDNLINWAKMAKLQKGHSQYMALRNGFQIQIHQFFKTTMGTIAQ